MTNDLIRIHVDALQDAAYGVNALLPDVPRDAGDPQPPAIAAVYDETRHGWLARRQLSRDGSGVLFPFLGVLLLQDLELEGEVQTTFRDGRASVLVLYVHKEVDTAKALTAGGYTLRAVQRSFRQLHAPEHEAARTRNGIHLKLCTGLREIPAGVLGKLGFDIQITAALAASYDLRDLAP